jgi:hypothetical protein
MPKSKYAERGKVKPKSIKAKVKLSAKRKLSRFGAWPWLGAAGPLLGAAARTDGTVAVGKTARLLGRCEGNT